MLYLLFKIIIKCVIVIDDYYNIVIFKFVLNNE